VIKRANLEDIGAALFEKVTTCDPKPQTLNPEPLTPKPEPLNPEP